mgnify:CR=1 FL=1
MNWYKIGIAFVFIGVCYNSQVESSVFNNLVLNQYINQLNNLKKGEYTLKCAQCSK